MNTKEFLNTVCEQLKYKPARKPISEELENHIEDIKNDNLCKGYLEDEAEEKAVKQMGDARKIGKKLNKIHRPKFDWKLVLLILILIAFRGILWLEDYSTITSSWEIKRSIMYMIIGSILALVIYLFDYRKSKKWANLIYFSATMILIFQWINWYFNLDMKVFELMYCINMRLWNLSIPLYIISFAGYMADYKKEDFLDMVILYTISCALIYAQSGSITNTAILIVAYLAIIASKMLQKNSIRKVTVVCGGTICTTLIVMLLMTNIKGSLLFCGTTQEETYSGYWYENSQRYEEEILNNLQLIGHTDEIEEVLYQSNSSHFRFLYILGRLGIIPATILATTIIFMCVRIIRNSKNIKDSYGKYLIIGLGTTYVVQSIMHILMNLNLWIRADVNLPFVAEGNLYFLINALTFAVILSVYRRKNINFEVNTVMKASESSH